MHIKTFITQSSEKKYLPRFQLCALTLSPVLRILFLSFSLHSYTSALTPDHTGAVTHENPGTMTQDITSRLARRCLVPGNKTNIQYVGNSFIYDACNWLVVFLLPFFSRYFRCSCDVLPFLPPSVSLTLRSSCTKMA